MNNSTYHLHENNVETKNPLQWLSCAYKVKLSDLTDGEVVCFFHEVALLGPSEKWEWVERGAVADQNQVTKSGRWVAVNWKVENQKKKKHVGIE